MPTKKKNAIPDDKSITKLSDKQLSEIFEDKDLAIFFIEWLGCGMNATKAYIKLHPTVDRNSARVLGSRWLARVNITDIMEAYDLGPEQYLKKLREGLEAKTEERTVGKNGRVYKRAIPDYVTRRGYHDKLGRILGIEKSDKEVSVQPVINTQVNLNAKKFIKEV